MTDIILLRCLLKNKKNLKQEFHEKNFMKKISKKNFMRRCGIYHGAFLEQKFYKDRRKMITFDELKKVPLIDIHAHRIHPDRAPDLSQVSGYIPGPGQEIHSRNTLLYGMIMERLRTYFRMPKQASYRDIEAERDRRYHENPQAYFRELISDCNVAMYCMEVGSPLFCPSYTEEEIAYFNASLPEQQQCRIVRIERLMDELLPQKLPFGEYLDTFDREFTNQLKEERTVGIKSCIAYYGGLDIELYTLKEAAEAYERIRCGKADGQDTRTLYQFFLLHGTDFAAEYDLPIQIHTGHGAGSYVDYRTMNPIFMTKFLLDSRVKDRVKIVLLHAGNPYEEDTGNLVLQFSNVYSDFSGAIWSTSVNGPGRLRALLERAPLDKIMYGSDANMLPELYWFSPDRFREILVKVLNELIEEHALSESRAYDAAGMLMYENALSCYSKIKQWLP